MPSAVRLEKLILGWLAELENFCNTYGVDYVLGVADDCAPECPHPHWDGVIRRFELEPYPWSEKHLFLMFIISSWHRRLFGECSIYFPCVILRMLPLVAFRMIKNVPPK